MIIGANENLPDKIYLFEPEHSVRHLFDSIYDPHGHTRIFKIKKNFGNEIVLLINDDTFVVNVNCEYSKYSKYTKYDNKILMSTIVKDEDNYILQWINYHSKLGIDHFIIYDNSFNQTLLEVLKDYILNGSVLLIKWAYPYLMPKSGLSGQTTQQNHSIHAFKNSKYIGLFDVDEYINPQHGYTNLVTLLDSYIEENKIDTNTIGSFTPLEI